MVAKLQGDKSASQSSMELYYPWISGPLRRFLKCFSVPGDRLTVLNPILDVLGI